MDNGSRAEPELAQVGDGLTKQVTGAGPRVLLIHGVGLDHGMWAGYVDRLGDRYTTITVDLPGHGDTAPSSPSSLAELADNVAAVLADESAHVIGFSLGALVAEMLAVRRPGLVDSLVLLNSVARRRPDELAAVRLRLAQAREGIAGLAAQTVARWVGDDWLARDPTVKQRLLALILQVNPQAYVACYSVLAGGDAEIADLLSRISCPTLVMTGANDQGSTPAMSAHIAGAVQRARLRIIPHAGHLLPLEYPDVVLGEIEQHLHNVSGVRPSG